MKLLLKILLAITIIFIDMWVLSFAGSLASMPNDIAVIAAWAITVAAAILNYIIFKYIFNSKKTTNESSN